MKSSKKRAASCPGGRKGTGSDTRRVGFIGKLNRSRDIPKENIRYAEFIPEARVLIQTRDSKMVEFTAEFNGAEMAEAIRGLAK